MNAIFIHDLRVETKIGVYEWERHMPQTIRIDLEFGLPSARPFTSGDFADAVDYAAVVQRINIGGGGVMPAWGTRLDPVTIKALTVYVHTLGGGQ